METNKLNIVRVRLRPSPHGLTPIMSALVIGH
nr:MAG TPA: hypothetical protein [Caudoviricetes sp.]